MDYSKLSLTQAKRLEMESQVHALELEKELEMERTRLAELRKIHYHLAGASEGWEVHNTLIRLSPSITCTTPPLYLPSPLLPSPPLPPPPPAPTHTCLHRKSWRVNYPLCLSSRNMRTPNFFFLLYKVSNLRIFCGCGFVHNKVDM